MVTAWIIFGLLIGLIINLIDPSAQKQGFLGSIVLGVVGAVMGGVLGSVILDAAASNFNFSNFLIPVLGSFLLIFINRILSRD